MNLQEIKELAISNKACATQLNKFNELLDNNDELSAWQTVLGNYHWLRRKGFTMELSEVEALANGVGKRWYENGQLRAELNYKNGKLDGLSSEWYDNGQLLEETNFKDTQRDGLHRLWYDNGQLRVETNYKDGEEHGLYRRWYKNGQINVEYNYKDGEYHGLSREWYYNGRLMGESNYIDGKLIGEIIDNIEDKQKALKFWNGLSTDMKLEYLTYMKKYGQFDATPENITDEQIIQLWIYAV